MTLRALLLTGLLTMTAQAEVKKTAFGTLPDGKAVDKYTLSDHDMSVDIITYGARITAINVPDKAGKTADVVLGYKDLTGYTGDKSTYFGAIVGRYGNRIAKGTFILGSKTFNVPVNNNGQSLHGGLIGFDQKVWTAKEIHDGVELSLLSPDGDQGYPGALTVHVRYTLKDHALRIEYAATTTAPTVLNLTNHSYFNLGGENSGTILNTEVTIPADRYTPVDAVMIPTGIAPVAGTPFDFRTPHTIGERIGQANEQLTLAKGYDHNWVLNGAQGTLKMAAKAVDPATGRTLTVQTTEPGVQFYTGNFLDGTLTGAGGTIYQQRSGFCFETQHFPDSPNHPDFPTTQLNPGKTYVSETVFTFGVQK